MASLIRIFRSAHIYPDALTRYYSNPDSKQQPYSAQMKGLYRSGVGFGDSWHHYLEATGRYTVFEAVIDAEPAQRRWAEENKIPFSEKSWKTDILAAQLAVIQPHVWFSHALIPSALRLHLRSQVPSLKVVIGYDGFYGHNPELFRGCDAMLTCVEETAAFYRQHGFMSLYWPHGFDPRLLGHLSRREELLPAVFSGSIILTQDFHFKRARLLKMLSNDTDVHLAMSVVPASHKSFLRGMASRLKHCDWSGFGRLGMIAPTWHWLLRHSHPAAFGLEMLEILYNSKIVLNIHGDLVRTAANMRLFEATGVGACLLTDAQSNLLQLFTPDKEIVVFASPSECASKLKSLLNDSKLAAQIAAAGQRRCLCEHSMAKRLAEIDRFITTLT